MIFDFKQFGLEHIISIIIPCIIGGLFILWGLSAKSDEMQKRIRVLLAITIVSIRAVRYFMDIYYGRFDWYDLFSLQICHVDLILLTICLIKPRDVLYNFNFLIGIPMGMAVALLPGTNHAEPGTLRAMFFIMSHMMLVVGAVYLTIVEQMRPTVKLCLRFAIGGSGFILLIFFINKALSSNFLYIMEAPAGSVIKKLDNIFGWPGYVAAMYSLAVLLMFLMLFISKLFIKPQKPDTMKLPMA